MTVRVEFEETIERPIGAVFDRLVDIDRYPEWMPDDSILRACSKDSTGPVGIGTTYTDRTRLGTIHGVVEEFDRPRRVVFHYRAVWFGWKAMEGWPGYELRPIGEQATRVRHFAQARLYGPMRLARPLVQRLAEKERRATVRALKRSLESSVDRPAVFLDRDGTILVEKHYLADPSDAELIPGAARAMRELADAGYALVVVSNQSGIARGLYGEAEYRAVDARMKEMLAEQGVEVAASYHCPHHPDFTAACACRKPLPGLFEQAIRELGLDAARSWLVGDRVRDVEPAAGLGARGILVRTGYGTGEVAAARERGIDVAPDLAAAASLIRSGGNAPSA